MRALRKLADRGDGPIDLVYTYWMSVGTFAACLAKRQEAVDRDFENEAVVLAGKNMTCDIPACMIDEQVDKHLEQIYAKLGVENRTAAAAVASNASRQRM